MRRLAWLCAATAEGLKCGGEQPKGQGGFAISKISSSANFSTLGHDKGQHEFCCVLYIFIYLYTYRGRNFCLLSLSLVFLGPLSLDLGWLYSSWISGWVGSGSRDSDLLPCSDPVSTTGKPDPTGLGHVSGMCKRLSVFGHALLRSKLLPQWLQLWDQAQAGSGRLRGTRMRCRWHLKVFDASVYWFPEEKTNTLQVQSHLILPGSHPTAEDWA